MRSVVLFTRNTKRRLSELISGACKNTAIADALFLATSHEKRSDSSSVAPLPHPHTFNRVYKGNIDRERSFPSNEKREAKRP